MKNNNNKHVISNLFVYLLIGVFAVMGTLLTLYTARGYQAAVKQSDIHNEQRVGGAFVLGAVRAGDASGLVSINNAGGVDVLEIRSVYPEEDGERVYVRRLYCSGGKMREYFTSEESFGDEREPFSPFDTDLGTEICDLDEMKLTLRDGLLTAYLTRPDGSTDTVSVAVRSGPDR